jgi:hypothetical protein
VSFGVCANTRLISTRTAAGSGRGGWLVPFADGGVGEIAEAGLPVLRRSCSAGTPLRVYWSQVADLKNDGGEGELQVRGSAGLARSLHTAGLSGEYRLLVAPATIGADNGCSPMSHRPLGTPARSRTTSTGAQYLALPPGLPGRHGERAGRQTDRLISPAQAGRQRSQS